MITNKCGPVHFKTKVKQNNKLNLKKKNKTKPMKNKITRKRRKGEKCKALTESHTCAYGRQQH